MGRVSGAAVPLILINGGEEVEFMMSPLSDKDLSELTDFVQEYYLRMARRSAKNETSEERDRIERIAQREAVTLTWTSGIGAKLIASVDGMARLVWQSVKKLHPDVSVTQLRAYMFSAENIREVNRLFRKANDLSEPGGPKGKKPKRAPRKRSPRKKSIVDSPASTNSAPQPSPT